MKSLLFIFIILSTSSYSQFSDPNFTPPSAGYGSEGSHAVGIVSFANPYYTSKNIEVYYPSDVAGKVPTIFFSHGHGGDNSANVSHLLNFIAKKGYAVVFVPYEPTATVNNRYINLLSGFRSAARTFTSIIDTTRVGFLGHSFGGGASFGLAYKSFTETGWGANGKFIFATAQWYSYHISQSELQSFPSDTKLIVEIFEDDTVNDHRMAADIFKNINIPSTEKDFITVKSDTIGGYIYAADHFVPNIAAFNALDYYAWFRLIDALADYTFTGSSAAKEMALGNGSSAQITMPAGLKNLAQTDDPKIKYPESKYSFPCSDIVNLRKSYCPPISGSLFDYQTDKSTIIHVFPNPVSSQLTIQFKYPEYKNSEWKIYNLLGDLIYEGVAESELTEIDCTILPSGMYCLVSPKGRILIVKE